MKGANANSHATSSDFVIVKGEGRHTYAWTAPRGISAKLINGWTREPVCAEIYKSWQAADRAIERYRKLGRVGFDDAQYCTYGEWLRLLNGESLA